MRLRIYAPDGTPQWGPNIPASTGSSRLGGELVVGMHGSWEKQRESERRAAVKKREARVPGANGRPRLSPDIEMIGRGRRPGYASEEERLAARRKAWRLSKERARASRARAKGYNTAVEYSDPIAHNAQRPAVRLYSESRGVDVREYRPNAT